MADTWTVAWNTIARNVDPIIAILNAGADTLKIRRVGMVNNMTAAAAPGGLLKGKIQLYGTTASLPDGTAVTPQTHDTNNGALDSVTVTYDGTPATTGSTYDLRDFVFSTEEPAASSTADIEEMLTFVPLGIVFDPGYGNTDVQPLTLNTDEMFVISTEVAPSAGTQSGWVEFTNE
jgi:hypothetical protein